MATEQLSGTIVLIIIAIGVQVCIMLIIFAKRQIMRFALRNRSGPHMHVGQGTSRKSVIQEKKNMPNQFLITFKNWF